MVTEGSRRVVLAAAPYLGAGYWRWWWGLSHRPQQQRRLQAELAAGVCGKGVKDKVNLQGKNCELDLDVVTQKDLVKKFKIMTQANGFSSKLLNWLIGSSAQGRSQNRDDRRLTWMNIYNGFDLISGNKLYKTNQNNTVFSSWKNSRCLWSNFHETQYAISNVITQTENCQRTENVWLQNLSHKNRSTLNIISPPLPNHQNGSKEKKVPKVRFLMAFFF